MPMLNIHPAPGWGEMLPGWHAVQNSRYQPPVIGSVGRGIQTALLTVPGPARNILLETASAVGRPAGDRSRGPVYVNGVGHVDPGMGALDLGINLDPKTWDWKTWVIVIGLGVLVLGSMRTGRLDYKAAKYGAKADYYATLAQAKRKHPSVLKKATSVPKAIIGGVSGAIKGIQSSKGNQDYLPGYGMRIARYA